MCESERERERKKGAERIRNQKTKC